MINLVTGGGNCDSFGERERQRFAAEDMVEACTDICGPTWGVLLTTIAATSASTTLVIGIAALFVELRRRHTRIVRRMRTVSTAPSRSGDSSGVKATGVAGAVAAEEVLHLETFV